MEDLNDIYFFASVVQYGEFSAAARRIGVEKTRPSRRIAALEKRLGVRLLPRTTRALALKETGQRFSERCVATEALFDVFGAIQRYWKTLDFKVTDKIEQGSRVAFFGSFTYKSTATGKEITSPFSLLARIEGDKAAHVQFLEDRFVHNWGRHKVPQRSLGQRAGGVGLNKLAMFNIASSPYSSRSFYQLAF